MFPVVPDHRTADMDISWEWMHSLHRLVPQGVSCADPSVIDFVAWDRHLSFTSSDKDSHGGAAGIQRPWSNARRSSYNASPGSEGSVMVPGPDTRPARRAVTRHPTDSHYPLLHRPPPWCSASFMYPVVQPINQYEERDHYDTGDGTGRGGSSPECRVSWWARLGRRRARSSPTR